MKYQFLIFIDGLVKPFYMMMNALKWRGKMKKKEQHFIVLKFFGLGSITRIVHVMNTIGIEKKQVTFVTLYSNKAVIDLLDLNVIYVKTKHPFVLMISLFKLVLQIWKQKTTTILDMERVSNLSGLFRLIVGIGKHCSSFYFKPKNKNTRVQSFVSLQNKPATNAIAEMFNKTYACPSVKYNTKEGGNNKIFININAGNYLLQRRFTLSKYASLIKELHDKNPDWHFYLTGAKPEFTFVASFEERLINLGVTSKKISNIAGQHNLSEFVECLKETKLFITNDSGPLHLAYLFGIRTVGIWGPTSSKLVGYQENEQMLNLELDMSCSPCFIHPKSQIARYCQGDVTCFKSMNPKEMASKIIRFVESEKYKVLIE
ncbi:glycosyltransferase family 9 protein [Aquimarina algiphila]|uniref:Glycosyltransferase family 9 protein n=1 Tax=Aquimarina algiphila TaxID=2047982 RepID=A0A554VEM5_9FLAO|nr:glycosyltransferase family 9 protein [Aquimarina algiphila]TSE05539.1 glycosyltransferase family 9 protein [Aquimarina algiphila]